MMAKQRVRKPATSHANSSNVVLSDMASIQKIERFTTACIVTLATLFVVVHTRPWLWVLDTTPTGGDFAAHVWAPAYLRDVLLSELRLTGWSHDWYVGFPIFTFYMVTPFILIVILNVSSQISMGIYALMAMSLSGGMIAWNIANYLITKQEKLRIINFPPPLTGLFAPLASLIGVLAAIVVSVILNSLDGRTVSFILLKIFEFTYNDTSVDLFLACMLLPIACGRLVWSSFSHSPTAATRISPGAPQFSKSHKTASQKPAKRDGLNSTDNGDNGNDNTTTLSFSLARSVLPQKLHNFITLSVNWRYFRLPITTLAVVSILLIIPVPYEVAIKLVGIAGVVFLPIAAYTMARLADIAFPGPALAAVAAVLFVFDRSQNIYGGNLMSTMAGEFAYSLGLLCAVFYIGVAFRGMKTGNHKILAAILLALTGLTHLITAFLALAATGAMFLILPWYRKHSKKQQPTTKNSRTTNKTLTILRCKTVFRWTITMGSLAAALSAWWVLPFWWNRVMYNNMGWGKERNFLSSLWSRSKLAEDFLTNQPFLQLFIVLAVLAAVIGFIQVLFQRRNHFIVVLAVTTLIFAISFILLPEGRLWNTRLLPFYYFLVYTLALLGLGEVLRFLTLFLSTTIFTIRQPVKNALNNLNRLWTGGLGIMATLLAIFLISTVQLEVQRKDDRHPGPYWVEYNYKGYEQRPPLPEPGLGGGNVEYQNLIETLQTVGSDYGCGPSLWEYEKRRLESYGSAMAPMLLPHWTDRCIGSMEGLYFESSATTPYHFLMQAELSTAPSRAQRDLPYSNLDVAKGVEHLKLLGVRYYLASSSETVDQARQTAGLTEIATSGPWVIFLVADSERIKPLSKLPVVVEDIPNSADDWLIVGVGAFLADDDMPLLASEGPNEWPRITMDSLVEDYQPFDSFDSLQQIVGRRLDVMHHLSETLNDKLPHQEIAATTEVDGIEYQPHRISFSVSDVGVPILVSTSFFPNWSAEGAQGPYRVTPNLMVVVPTETEVSLHYGHSSVERLSYVITLIGLITIGLLFLQGARTTKTHTAVNPAEY